MCLKTNSYGEYFVYELECKRTMEKIYTTTSFVICIISVTKRRGVKWARHVARIGELRNRYKVLNGKP